MSQQMKEGDIYNKVSTFTKTPGLPQICSYITFLVSAVLFYSCIVPNYESSGSKVSFTILYTFSLIGIIIFTVICSGADPADQYMIQYRNGNRQRISDIYKNGTENMLYCDHCRSYVKSKSRHCRSCDRCSQQFDHHCMWINNCVGGKNYKSFFAMILSTFANLSLYIASIAVLTVQNNWNGFKIQFSIAWAIAVVIAVFWLFIINLIALHIYLMCRGISTYEFIMAQKEQEIIQKIQKEKENQIEREQSNNQMKINNQKNQPSHQLKRDINQAEETNAKIKKSENQGQQPSTNAFHLETNKQSNQKSKVSSKMIRIKSQNSEQNNEKITKSKFMQEIDNKKYNEIIKDQIFENHEVDLTEKSQNSEQNPKRAKHKQKRQNKQEAISNQDENSEVESLKISQLFIRNKSLKLILGKSQVYQPHRPISNDEDYLNHKKNKEIKKKSISMHAQNNQNKAAKK